MPLNTSIGRLLAACAACALLGEVAAAQAESPPKPGTVHATGLHELKLKPQKLRLTLTVRAQGKDAKSAIEAFMAHKERVKKELSAMKADESSIEFGATQVTGGIAGMPAEMQAYSSRYLAQIAKAVPNVNAADVPKIYQATAQVRAEWPLPTADPDALALLPETLREQIKSRDLAGEKNKAKLDGRQQEKLEELQAAMQENMGYNSNSEESSPLTIMFIAKIDKESRLKGMKEAFDRAVAQAKLLATAAGHRTGDLISLRSSDVPSSGLGESGYAYTPAYQAAYAAYAASGLDVNATDEAQSMTANEVKFGTRVDVEFALAK